VTARRGAPLAVLLLALAIVIAAVAGGGDSKDEQSRAQRGAPATETAGAPAAPRPAAYEPPRGDVSRVIKRLSGRAAERLTTYPAGTTARELAARIVNRGGTAGTTARAVRPLLSPGASTGRVLYPQLGGLTATEASVMVVVRQRVQAAERPATTVTRTLDVRLRRSNTGWGVDHLASAGGSPVAAPERLSPEARKVLGDPRIRLPDSARWDIYRGEVDEGLLRAMAAAAKRAPYAVTVIDSGHPRNVFATSRPSAHSAGSAVDIYEVDGRLVVRQRGQGTPAYSFARALYGARAYQLGSPWAFTGGGSSFTDAVHQDHIHLQQAAASTVAAAGG
jgi:hypothetical protein